MENKKVLNLYAGIGGNRKLWQNVDVTAVELNPEIAKIYKDLYPSDNVLVEDAHAYLLNHYKEFDIIWTSPPCQTHSSFRFNISVRYGRAEAEYPDMRLYQEIIFLSTHFDGKWIVENVDPYYEPLIPAIKLQRHLFWANFNISKIKVKEDVIREAQIPELQKLHCVDLSDYQIENKRQILRNCVNSELGKEILESALKEKQKALASSSLASTPAYPLATDKSHGVAGAEHHSPEGEGLK